MTPNNKTYYPSGTLTQLFQHNAEANAEAESGAATDAKAEAEAKAAAKADAEAEADGKAAAEAGADAEAEVVSPSSRVRLM